MTGPPMRVADGVDASTPTRGHVCAVDAIPACDCGCGRPGRWDVVTTLRPGLWANLCDECAARFAAYPTTGVGRGQLWIVS